MKTRLTLDPRGRRLGFTMVEIALCIAVVGFALVAIIGILPTAMSAQRDNREETIINHDVPYLLEAVRNGAQGMDDLTNYVDAIVMRKYDPSGDPTKDTLVKYQFGAGGPPSTQFSNGRDVVGLITGGAYDGYGYDELDIDMYSMSGLALDKVPAAREVGFKYRVRAFIRDFRTENPDFLPDEHAFTASYLYEIRFVALWSLRGTVPGRARQVFRAMVSSPPPQYDNDGSLPVAFFNPLNPLD